MANRPEISMEQAGKLGHTYTIVFTAIRPPPYPKSDEQLGCAMQHSQQSQKIRTVGRWLIDVNTIDPDTADGWSMEFPDLTSSVVWNLFGQYKDDGSLSEDQAKRNLRSMEQQASDNSVSPPPPPLIHFVFL